jgi:xylulokinase
MFPITGLNLDPSHVAPKIRWLADNHPHIFGKTAHFLLPGSYVAFALTGELGVDYSNASSTLLMDVRTRAWSQQMCAAFEIPISSLPPIYPATHVIGTLKPDVAEGLGLLSKTRVILGSGDEHAACLGAGVTRPGLVCDIAGTAEPVCASSQTALFDESGLVETHCHADPDLWLLENPGFVSGANYRWFRDQFSVQEVARAAKREWMRTICLIPLPTVPPGSDGLIFVFLMGAMAPPGMRWRAYLHGFCGASPRTFRAPFWKLRLCHPRHRSDAMGLPLEKSAWWAAGAQPAVEADQGRRHRVPSRSPIR